jgi:hypothetical protein
MAGLTEPNQVGKREDLSDLISNLDRRACPVMSLIKKGPALKNSLFDFQVDAFDDPTLDGVVDGEDVTTFANKAENRVRLQGRVQKVRKPWKVSDFSENLSDVAGLRSEKAESIAKCLVEAKRSMEAVICSDQESQADDGTNPYKTRGLGKWINNSAQTDLPVPSAFRTPTASIDSTAINHASAPLTETIVQNVLTSIWNQTGEVKRFVMPCGSVLKRRFTDFTRLSLNVSSNTDIRTYNQPDATQGKIYASVDMFVGDFGELELVPAQFLAWGTGYETFRGYILDTNRMQLRTLRMPSSMELDDEGGGPRGYVDAVFALQVDNPLGFGKFAATSNT